VGPAVSKNDPFSGRSFGVQAPAQDLSTCVGPLWAVIVERQNDRGDSDRCDLRHLLRDSGCIARLQFEIFAKRSGVSS
jgi:hypothetical protein